MYRNMDIDEKLIGLVQKYPCLYNAQSAEYVDKKLKYRVWSQISQEMNLSIAECSKKWKILRDCYRQAMRVRKRMLAAGRTCRKPIKFEKELRFLAPHITTVIPTPQRDKPDDDALSDKISRLYEQCVEAKNLENPVDSFFMTMSRKVKVMPKKIQTEIERGIFRIVNEAETKLVYDNCSTSPVETIQYLPEKDTSVEVQYMPVYITSGGVITEIKPEFVGG